MLESLGARVVEVRRPAQLDEVAGIVLPGGESTTLAMLLASSGLVGPLRERLASRMPAFGTCAGMILLSTAILDGRADQEPLGAIDLTVRRNAFGRQIESFEADLEVRGVADGPMHAVFIRAPVVERVGPGVEILAGTVTVAAFHPEVAGESRLHELFLADLVSGQLGQAPRPAAAAP
jgi:5'-phosphate synthase pdxT subunit